MDLTAVPLSSEGAPSGSVYATREMLLLKDHGAASAGFGRPPALPWRILLASRVVCAPPPRRQAWKGLPLAQMTHPPSGLEKSALLDNQMARVQENQRGAA